MDPEKPTLIDAHGDVEGNLRGKDAQICGRFRGEIELSGRLVLGEGARVQAKAVADAAEIGGEFRGELKVRSLVLLEKGRLEGTLEAQTMAVREGAQLNGSINTGPSRAGGGLKAPSPSSGVLAG
jgi:cytoskeletal protein CcmA (bactofilin family)